MASICLKLMTRKEHAHIKYIIFGVIFLIGAKEKLMRDRENVGMNYEWLAWRLGISAFYKSPSNFCAVIFTANLINILLVGRFSWVSKKREYSAWAVSVRVYTLFAEYI